MKLEFSRDCMQGNLLLKYNNLWLATLNSHLMNSLLTGAQNQNCWSATWATPAGHSTRAKSILGQGQVEVTSLTPSTVLSVLCALLSQVLITRILWTSWVPEFTQLRGRAGLAVWAPSRHSLQYHQALRGLISTWRFNIHSRNPGCLL